MAKYSKRKDLIYQIVADKYVVFDILYRWENRRNQNDQL